MDKKANITTIENLKRGLNKSALFDINNKIQKMKILYKINKKNCLNMMILLILVIL